MAVVKGTVLNLLRVARLPIYTQLHLEESLLRATKENWFLINDGAFNPAIVMGISGRPHELLHVEAARASGVQLIRRFTGGGTVVVDADTLFATLILQGDCVSGVDPYPQPVMRWTEGLYRPAFDAAGCPGFSLRENDYVVSGARKVGGNAQAITGRRWLHHTSFLWDFDAARMALLRQPPRAPQYREGRPHGDFVVRLREVLGQGPGQGPDPDRARRRLLDALAGAVEGAGFRVQEVGLAEAAAALPRSPLLGTKLVDLAALGPQPG